MKFSIKKTLNFVLLFLINITPLFADDSATNAQTKETLSYLPGGEEVKKLVEARRGKTELSKAAMKMEPGAWVTLDVTSPKDLWTAPHKTKLHIGTWSDDGQWDSRTGQFLYFGVRQARKLVAFSEEKNEWRNIEFEGKPNAPELLQKYGHQYSCNSLDPERSILFTHLWSYNIQTDTWGKIPDRDAKMNSMTYEYFTAIDGLLTLDRNGSTISCYQESKKSWSQIAKGVPVHGYHSLARHNPYLKEVLFAGGNDSYAIMILTKEGNVVKKKDLPIKIKKFTIRTTKITIDPISGRYLILLPGKIFIEYDSVKDEHRLIDDFTKTTPPAESLLTAHIPEYGVSLWTGGNKIQLYKHKLCTQAPIDEKEAQRLVKLSESREK